MTSYPRLMWLVKAISSSQFIRVLFALILCEIATVLAMTSYVIPRDSDVNIPLVIQTILFLTLAFACLVGGVRTALIIDESRFDPVDV